MKSLSMKITDYLKYLKEQEKSASTRRQYHKDILNFLDYFGTTPASKDPVSYTHLDVYKRQARNMIWISVMCRLWCWEKGCCLLKMLLPISFSTWKITRFWGRALICSRQKIRTPSWSWMGLQWIPWGIISQGFMKTGPGLSLIHICNNEK